MGVFWLLFFCICVCVCVRDCYVGDYEWWVWVVMLVWVVLCSCELGVVFSGGRFVGEMVCEW